MKETILKVEGMSCEGCEQRIERALKEIRGIEKVEADHTRDTVKITSRTDVSERDIIRKIEDLGYDVR